MSEHDHEKLLDDLDDSEVLDRVEYLSDEIDKLKADLTEAQEREKYLIDQINLRGEWMEVMYSRNMEYGADLMTPYAETWFNRKGKVDKFKYLVKQDAVKP